MNTGNERFRGRIRGCQVERLSLAFNDGAQQDIYSIGVKLNESVEGEYVRKRANISSRI